MSNNSVVKHTSLLVVVCTVSFFVAIYSYVAGTQAGFASGSSIAPLHEALDTKEPAAIAKVIPSVLQAAKNDKDVLMWAVAVTNDPSLATEHHEAILAYCQAKGSFFAELTHRLFAIGVPQC